MRPIHLPLAFIALAAAVPPYIKNFWEAIDVAKAGLVPGEWNPDLVSPPPPPGAAPPPWWARGVGGDKYYDWNKREQGWEALISAGDVQPAVRRNVQSIALRASELFLGTTGAAFLFDCATPQCAYRGLTFNGTSRPPVKEPQCLPNSAWPCEDPAADQESSVDFESSSDAIKTAPASMSERQIAHPSEWMTQATYRNTPADKSSPQSARSAAAARRQQGYSFLNPKDDEGNGEGAAQNVYQPGAADNPCDDNDELVANTFNGDFESCEALIEVAEKYGVACDTPLPPFGYALDSIQAACPKSCQACTAEERLSRGWHEIGAIARFYKDLGEYEEYLRAAFAKLLVVCDSADNVPCEGWRAMVAPGADISYDLKYHYFSGPAQPEEFSGPNFGVLCLPVC